MTVPRVVGLTGPLADLLEGTVPYEGTLAAGIVFVTVLIVVVALGRVVGGRVFERALEVRGLDAHAKRPLRKLFNGVVVFLAVAVAFGTAGFGNFLQAVATIAAAATLAIGFALQDVIKNFVAGVFIFTDKPFRIGDWIEWDGNAGIVEDISLRVTRVRTFDNELLTVPNVTLTDGVVKNPVANDQLRMKFVFGIGYDDDIERATEVIIEEARDHADILEEPAPSVRVVELGDSSVGLQSRVWIADPTRGDFVAVRGEYVQAVKERFDEEGISMPYPNRTVGGELELANAESVVDPGE